MYIYYTSLLHNKILASTSSAFSRKNDTIKVTTDCAHLDSKLLPVMSTAPISIRQLFELYCQKLCNSMVPNGDLISSSELLFLAQ
jgi:hypothetical protein